MAKPGNGEIARHLPRKASPASQIKRPFFSPDYLHVNQIVPVAVFEYSLQHSGPPSSTLDAMPFARFNVPQGHVAATAGAAAQLEPHVYSLGAKRAARLNSWPMTASAIPMSAP